LTDYEQVLNEKSRGFISCDFVADFQKTCRNLLYKTWGLLVTGVYSMEQLSYEYAQAMYLIRASSIPKAVMAKHSCFFFRYLFCVFL